MLQASINATLACGMTFVILTGGIDLSVGSIVAFSGIILGAMLKANFSLGVAVILCILLGGICGLINGLLVTAVNLPPFISTLGIVNSSWFSNIYFKGTSNSRFSGRLNFIGSGEILGIPFMIYIMIITFIIGWFILKYTNQVDMCMLLVEMLKQRIVWY